MLMESGLEGLKVRYTIEFGEDGSRKEILVDNYKEYTKLENWFDYFIFYMQTLRIKYKGRIMNKLACLKHQFSKITEVNKWCV